jgi:eukaryotic-like serine/threonine-protein kinase
LNDDAALVLAAGFRDARLVARGGAARVYRAQHAGSAVALKVVDLSLADGLAREATLLSRVGPPLVPGVRASLPQLLVLEWLDGATLSAWAVDAAPAARQAMALAVCEVLAGVHRAGVVHRDVKGSNVMVSPTGQVRWFDFGLACLEGELEPPRQGTAIAMAPESWDGGRVSTRTDVYGLGVLLYGLLTGRAPFVGDAAQLERAHRQERAPAAGLTSALDALLARCLAKNPSDRFVGAAEVSVELRRALSAAVADEGTPAAAAVKSTSPVATALVAVRSELPVPQLSRAMEAEGAIWAGTLDGAQLFARPHPLGPASGLERLRAALDTLPSVRGSTLHVAALTVRVGRSSVRVSGEALADPRWLAGGAVTDAAARHHAARPAHNLTRAEPPWLEDGSRLPAVLAALEGPGPRLVWVCAPSGSGRTRLLHEVAAVVGGRARWLTPQADAAEVASHVAQGGVLLVDGAERLGWAVWEALEAATAPGSATRLDVVVAGDAQVAVARPGLGSRAATFCTVTPRLLAEGEAEALVRALLVPAQLLPSEVVLQLSHAGDGYAGHLVELVEVLRRRGLLAPDPHTGEWRLSSEALGGELTARLSQAALAELPSALHDAARLLAFARWPITVPQLQRALEALPTAFEARRLDAEAVVGRLVTLGVLERAGASIGWVQRGVRQALLAEAGARVAQLHAALAAVLDAELGSAALSDEVRAALPEVVGLTASVARPSGSLASRQQRLAFAHHAHAAGSGELAHLTASAVGLEALAQGDALTADTFLSRALAFARDADDTLRLARARARRQLEHFEAALEDARGVMGEPALRVAALLEASLSLDWLNQFQDANEVAEAALELGAPYEHSPTPLGRALRLARGRLDVRAGRWAAASAVLEPLCVLQVEPGEVETVLGAYALAGSVACVEGRLARAEALFADGLRLAEQHGQPVVGCALLINRPMLWMAQGRIEQALTDFRSAAEVSRRLGHAQIERVASLNLAQYLLWQGRFAEAEPLARRASTLAQLRLGGRTPAADALLLARLALARGEVGEARARLGQVDGDALNPSDALQRALVRAWLGDQPWAEVLLEREGVVPEELLEAALVAREQALLRGQHALEAEAIEVIVRLAPHAKVTRDRMPRATGV